MYKSYPIALWMILASLFFSMNAISADEEILIDTDEKAKEILLGHDWECEWKDILYAGTNKVVYEEVSLKKLTGKVKNSFCPTAWGKIKGKIKKGKLTVTHFNFLNADEAPPCIGSTFTGSTLYKSADGSYYTKGTYTHSAYEALGSTSCVSVPK